MQHSASAAAGSDASRRRESLVRLEQEGHSAIDDIVASAREVPWTLNVLQLLWTAGPVVYLAMQGGHYLGFGTAASPRNILFFAAYTFLFGAIGLVARFAAAQVRDRRQRVARSHLTRALDLLPELIFSSRDIGLAQMPAEGRRREAARVLLHKADLGPEGVALGVQELSGDSVLAEAAKRIDIFRRLGMYTRVQELVAGVADRRAAALDRLQATAPEAAEVLRARLSGDAPSQDAGVPRGDGFLERILAAAEREDTTLMSLADVEDLLVLALELISGREIRRLTFAYDGDWRVARALDEVEAARNHYRMTQGAAVGHLQSLATFLVDSGSTALRDEELALAAPALLDRCTTALEVMILARQRSAPTATSRQQETLRGALGLVKRLRRSMEQAKGGQARYQRALERWQALRQHAATVSGRGLRIAERRIRLTDQQKLQVAAALCQYLDELRIRPGERGMVRGNGAPFGASDARRLAIQIVLILEPVLHFGDASIQRAIETSNAAYFHGLETGFSADAKAGLAAAVSREVRQDLSRTAERLALRLSRVYQVPLTPSMVDFLSVQYGANRERLDIIASTPVDASGPAFVPPAPALDADVRRWRRIVQNAERLLDGAPEGRSRAGAGRGGTT